MSKEKPSPKNTSQPTETDLQKSLTTAHLFPSSEPSNEGQPGKDTGSGQSTKNETGDEGQQGTEE